MMNLIRCPSPIRSAAILLCLAIFGNYTCVGQEVRESLPAPAGFMHGHWLMDTEFLGFAALVRDDLGRETNRFALAFTDTSSMGFVSSYWIAEQRDRIIIFIEITARDAPSPSLGQLSNGVYYIRMPDLHGRPVLISDGKSARTVPLSIDVTLQQVAPKQTLTPQDPFEL